MKSLFFHVLAFCVPKYMSPAVSDKFGNLCSLLTSHVQDMPLKVKEKHGCQMHAGSSNLSTVNSVEEDTATH